nr:MCP four helix bundle domain-containing protein [uncultured Massilia sp.]
MFNRMKVGTRLLAGFLTLAMLGAVVAAIGIYNMSQMNDRTDRLYKRELLGISHVKEANINLVLIGRALRNVMLASTEQDRRAAAAAIDKARSALQRNLDQARPLFFSENGKRMFAEVDRGMRDYEAVVGQAVRLAETEGLQESRAAVDYLLEIGRAHV